MDKKGQLHEKIYDLAVSDDRKIGEDGRCKQAGKSGTDHDFSPLGNCGLSPIPAPDEGDVLDGGHALQGVGVDGLATCSSSASGWVRVCGG